MAGPTEKVKAVTEQVAADGQFDEIVFITGPHGVGKTALANEALQGLCPVYDMGAIMRVHHQRDMPHASYEEWIAAGEQEHGAGFVTTLVGDHVEAETLPDNRPLVSILGTRSPGALNRLLDQLEPAEHRLVFVTAPEDVLFERWSTRKREGANLTYADFQQALYYDEAQGLDLLREQADLVLPNENELAVAATALRRFIQRED
jgi:energy-coupling factor transporter ATP-binding protein EcfA2